MMSVHCFVDAQEVEYIKGAFLDAELRELRLDFKIAEFAFCENFIHLFIEKYKHLFKIVKLQITIQYA